MTHFFTNWNHRLSENMFALVLSGLLLGFLIPIHYSMLLRKMVVALFAYMTFIDLFSRKSSTSRDSFYLISTTLSDSYIPFL
jgi:hypothetical protein